VSEEDLKPAAFARACSQGTSRCFWRSRAAEPQECRRRWGMKCCGMKRCGMKRCRTRRPSSDGPTAI